MSNVISNVVVGRYGFWMVLNNEKSLARSPYNMKFMYYLSRVSTIVTNMVALSIENAFDLIWLGDSFESF